MKLESSLMKIRRVQFTAWDSLCHPECHNPAYLEYEKVTSGLSEEIVMYGYQEYGGGGTCRWIKITEAKDD